MLASPQGACIARKRPAKDGREENRFEAWSFKPMRTHVMKFSAPRPVVTQKHDAGNTVFNSYQNSEQYWQDFTPKMTFFRTFEIFWEFGMCSQNSKILRTNWDQLSDQATGCSLSGLPIQSTTPHDHTGRFLPCTQHKLRIKQQSARADGLFIDKQTLPNLN